MTRVPGCTKLTVVSDCELVQIEALVERVVLEPSRRDGGRVVIVQRPHFWHQVAYVVGPLEGDGVLRSLLKYVTTADGIQIK